MTASKDAAKEGWPTLLAAHAAAWASLWGSDIVVPGQPDLQSWLRGGR